MNSLNSKLVTLLCLAGMLTVTNNALAQKINNSETVAEGVPIKNALQQLKQLEPLSFKANQDNTSAEEQYGFLVEDVQATIPGIIRSEGKFIPAGKNSFKTEAVQRIDMLELIPFLVSSIKEQQIEIEKLQAELKEVKNSIKK